MVGNETGCHQGYARDLGLLSFRGQERPKGLERGKTGYDTLRGQGLIRELVLIKLLQKSGPEMVRSEADVGRGMEKSRAF